jgi:predicted SpoU family rRNA methylase
MTKEEIRDEMIRRLAGRLEMFWEENAEVTTYDAFGQEVTFTIYSDEITAASERILQSARDRLVLVFLNENGLDPDRFERFVEPWMKEAQAYVEEQANAVATEL